MKRAIIKIVSAVFKGVDAILCRLHLKRPKVIVYVDGGICSQMLMYLQGLYYEEYDLDVRYDLLWFKKFGTDMDGILPRIFELTEMWPNLPFRKIEGIERWYYKHFFKIGEW